MAKQYYILVEQDECLHCTGCGKDIQGKALLFQGAEEQEATPYCASCTELGEQATAILACRSSIPITHERNREQGV